MPRSTKCGQKAPAGGQKSKKQLNIFAVGLVTPEIDKEELRKTYRYPYHQANIHA
jgi:hypothetical protein